MQGEPFGEFRATDVAAGIRLFAWPTDKFKVTTLRFSLLENLDSGTTARSLVGGLLRRGCRSFPDMMSLSRQLERMYGAALGVDVVKQGERHNTHVRVMFVDDRRLGGEGRSFREALDLMRQILAEPLADAGGFPAAEFEQERINLERAIEAQFDDKLTWAYQRFLQEMFRGEPFARTELGTVEEVRALERGPLLEFHRARLGRAPVDAYAVGDLAEADLAAIADTVRAIAPRGVPHAVARELERAPGAPRTVVEELPVAQSKLLIGYRVATAGLDDRDWVALGLYNMVLGGGNNLSKLFKEVREKRGLAYYASSGVDRLKGVLYLSAGVSARHWQAAADVMRAQVDEVRRGNVEPDELEAARVSLLNSLRSVHDSPNGAMEFAAAARASGRPGAIDVIARTLSSLDRDDVVRVAALPREDTTYVLVGTEDHGSETDLEPAE